MLTFDWLGMSRFFFMNHIEYTVTMAQLSLLAHSLATSLQVLDDNCFAKFSVWWYKYVLSPDYIAFLFPLPVY